MIATIPLHFTSAYVVLVSACVRLLSFCIHINYISKKEIPEILLESKKTESGYLKISNPALTACDLIQFEKRVGGINRVSTVLNELAESIKPEMFNNELFEHVLAYIERSRSGNGAHLWIFFEENLLAEQTRKLMFELLMEAGT